LSSKVRFVSKDPNTPAVPGAVYEVRVAVTDQELAALKTFFERNDYVTEDAETSIRMGFYHGLFAICDKVGVQDRSSGTITGKAGE